MKLFQENELRAAYEHARTGGQALHLYSNPGTYSCAPPCFKKYTEAAHLLDYNKHRLRQTVRSLGVHNIKIDRLEQRGQHVDLCGRPLEMAKELCNG